MTSIGSRLTKLDSDYNIRQVFLIVSLTILYCALIFKSLHAEGDLAKWSARDIHDIAGHHLPGVDLVVLVVNQVVVRIVRGEGDLIAWIQVERARLERLLSRSTGMVGYLRWVGLLLQVGMDGWFQWLVWIAGAVGMFCFLREYWGGFFPLLLVELTDGEEEAAAIEQRTVGCLRFSSSSSSSLLSFFAFF